MDLGKQRLRWRQELVRQWESHGDGPGILRKFASLIGRHVDLVRALPLLICHLGSLNRSYFSAVCWFSGRTLYDRLSAASPYYYSFPIGLISSNWCGVFLVNFAYSGRLACCLILCAPVARLADSTCIFC